MIDNFSPSEHEQYEVSIKRLHSSYRDPDGHIFRLNGEFYRCINETYGEEYEKLFNSGLYDELVSRKWLIPHVEIHDVPKPPKCMKIIKPVQIPFVTYPYEWAFGQLKEAAQLTLDVLSLSFDHGMILKDASNFNVTWYKGNPIFFDTLSFACYEEGTPWAGYRQFCTNFLAPLALMSYKDVRLQKLLVSFLDGIPLDMASNLLPKKTLLNLKLGIHIHTHSRIQKKYADHGEKIHVNIKHKTISNLIESLRVTVESLKFPKISTEWDDYYDDTNYSETQISEKKSIISDWIKKIEPATVIDLGANDGTFSRIAALSADSVISADIDPVAVHKNYMTCRRNHDDRLIPLLLDIRNPSPAIGWLSSERKSFFDRVKVDLGMALAIVHHLAIGANVPLEMIATLLLRLSSTWIIEFVDKSDSQVQRLLANRSDVFWSYDQNHFELSLRENFNIQSRIEITGTHRTLYLLEGKSC